MQMLQSVTSKMGITSGKKDDELNKPFYCGRITYVNPSSIPLGSDGSIIKGKTLEGARYIKFYTPGKGKLSAQSVGLNDASIKILNSIILQFKKEYRKINKDDEAQIYLCFYKNEKNNDREFTKGVYTEFRTDKQIMGDLLYLSNNKNNFNFIYRNKEEYSKFKELYGKLSEVDASSPLHTEIKNSIEMELWNVFADTGNDKLTKDPRSLIKPSMINLSEEEEEEEGEEEGEDENPSVQPNKPWFKFEVGGYDINRINSEIEKLKEIINNQKQTIEDMHKHYNEKSTDMEVDDETSYYESVINEMNSKLIESNHHLQHLTEYIRYQEKIIQDMNNEGINVSEQLNMVIKENQYFKKEFEGFNEKLSAYVTTNEELLYQNRLLENKVNERGKEPERKEPERKEQERKEPERKDKGKTPISEERKNEEDDHDEYGDSKMKERKFEDSGSDKESEKSNSINSDMEFEYEDGNDNYKFRNKREFTMGIRIIPKEWYHPAQNEIFYDKKKFDRMKNLKPNWNKYSMVDKRSEWAKNHFWKDSFHKDFYIH